MISAEARRIKDALDWFDAVTRLAEMAVQAGSWDEGGEVVDAITELQGLARSEAIAAATGREKEKT